MPVGSRKYTAAAGIQPMTLGSVVSVAEERERRDAQRAQAVARAEDVARATRLNATCSESPIGAEPSDQRPSIDSPRLADPEERRAAFRAPRSATGRPTTSR